MFSTKEHLSIVFYIFKGEKVTIFEPMRLKETTEQLSSGKKTAYEIVQECLRRINILEPDIKAWVSLDPASALERARELDALPPTQRAALHGIPVGVKDIINVAGMPTECALKNCIPH